MTTRCTVTEPEWPPTNPQETLVYERCRLCGDEMTTHHLGLWYPKKKRSLYDNDLCWECEDVDEHDRR